MEEADGRRVSAVTGYRLLPIASTLFIMRTNVTPRDNAGVHFR